MLLLSEKNECCGCSACAQICGEKAILMSVDEEGFLYPNINLDNCLSCGACKRVCPIMTIDYDKKNSPIGIYAICSNDERIRMNSSSGATFYLLARQIIEKDGVVFGAAWDSNCKVIHSQVSKLSDLYLLQGSKYIESNTANTYSEVKQLLENGTTVLFSGTGCQIAGLKSFLGKEYNNLYTVDVLCHGVPSPKVWGKYIKEKEECFNSTVVRSFFRLKNNGWKNYSIKLEFSNMKEYIACFKDDPFMRLFLRNAILRPSCYDCKFKDGMTPSDLTIGDAWGVNNYYPEMDDDKGTSLVVINTNKGKELLESIDKNDMLILHDKSELLLKRNRCYYVSVKPHKNREEVFEALNSGKTIRDMVKLTNPTLCERVKNFVYKALKKFHII